MHSIHILILNLFVPLIAFLLAIPDGWQHGWVRCFLFGFLILILVAVLFFIREFSRIRNGIERDACFLKLPQTHIQRMSIFECFRKWVQRTQAFFLLLLRHQLLLFICDNLHFLLSVIGLLSIVCSRAWFWNNWSVAIKACLLGCLFIKLLLQSLLVQFHLLLAFRHCFQFDCKPIFHRNVESVRFLDLLVRQLWKVWKETVIIVKKHVGARLLRLDILIILCEDGIRWLPNGYDSHQPLSIWLPLAHLIHKIEAPLQLSLIVVTSVDDSLQEVLHDRNQVFNWRNAVAFRSRLKELSPWTVEL